MATANDKRQRHQRVRRQNKDKGGIGNERIDEANAVGGNERNDERLATATQRQRNGKGAPSNSGRRTTRCGSATVERRRQMQMQMANGKRQTYVFNVMTMATSA
jgi:hypothetical protein